MNKRMLSIFIGNNSKGLLGCENDASMFYNLFETYKFSSIYKNKNKFLLIGKEATLYNLQKIFKNNKSINTLVIYFSGHGYYGGGLEFHEKIINPLEIYESINNTFINTLNIYFILDCCYSGSFPLVKKFQNINNVYILASCKENQTSSESFVSVNSEVFNKIVFNKNKYNKIIVLGTFTFNLIKLIKKNNINNIITLFNLENDNICDIFEINIIK